MTDKVKKQMKEILYNVQFNKTDHPQYMKELQKLLDKLNLNKFWECYLPCLKVPLTMASEHAHVTNSLEFYAKFSISFYDNTDNDSNEKKSPFLDRVFNFLLSNHRAKSKVVRYRICQFLKLLLSFMGDNAFIDDQLCDQITVNMMERLMDKSPKVRAQAVHALQRLQDPSNEQCPVIKMYLFHLSKDPAAQVRKAVLGTMGKNQQTLLAALKRTRDIDESVRKMAYLFITKITVRSLTIQQRERLLKNGLKDRTESVRSCITDVLLPTWLRHYKDEYVTFIHALDVGTGTETAVLALEALFKKAPLETLLDQVPIDKQMKLIPVAELSNENVLYWRCLIEHLERLSYTEQIDLILPELSRFCNYIREYIVASSNQEDIWEMQRHQFILLQLFEIIKTYDLSDEVGRMNLRDLIKDTLLSYPCSERIIGCVISHLVNVIPDVKSRLETVTTIINEIRLPSKDDDAIEQRVTAEQEQRYNLEKAKLKVKLNELEEEMYEASKNKEFQKAADLKKQVDVMMEKIKQLPAVPPMTEKVDKEKNDPETMKLCLSILYAAIQAQPLRALTPSLRTLKPFALESVNYPDNNVHILALKVLCLYCILDKELDKKYPMVFLYQFSREQEDPQTWIVGLKCIFDLLLIYGMDYFNIQQDKSSCNTKRNDIQDTKENSRLNKSKNNRTLHTSRDSISSINAHNEEEENVFDIVKFLMKLLDNQNQDLRTITVEGFCKLLLNRRIKSDNLLSQLIILCYNPANAEDTYLRQCLCAFFDHFVMRVPEALAMLNNAYFMTLRTLCDVSEVSSLQQVDTYHVSVFILSLIKRACQKFDRQIFRMQNLALAILLEILDSNSKIDRGVLVKSLTKLHIKVEDDSSKQELRKAIAKVKTEMQQAREKQLLKYIQDFQNRLENPERTMDSADEEEESENDD